MNVEQIEDLALLITRLNLNYSPTSFVTKEEDPVQLGFLRRPAGFVSEPHFHKIQFPESPSLFTEIVIVTKGTLLTTLFREDQTYVTTRLLNEGDVLLCYKGGHSFKAVTDVEFTEIKQGPFSVAAKVFFNPLAHEQMK